MIDACLVGLPRRIQPPRGEGIYRTGVRGIISATMDGSNKVDVSPNEDVSPSATFLNILLIIFPDLVFGSPETN